METASTFDIRNYATHLGTVNNSLMGNPVPLEAQVKSMILSVAIKYFQTMQRQPSPLNVELLKHLNVSMMNEFKFFPLPNSNGLNLQFSKQGLEMLQANLKNESSVKLDTPKPEAHSSAHKEYNDPFFISFSKLINVANSITWENFFIQNGNIVLPGFSGDFAAIMRSLQTQQEWTAELSQLIRFFFLQDGTLNSLRHSNTAQQRFEMLCQTILKIYGVEDSNQGHGGFKGNAQALSDLVQIQKSLQSMGLDKQSKAIEEFIKKHSPDQQPVSTSHTYQPLPHVPPELAALFMNIAMKRSTREREEKKKQKKKIFKKKPKKEA